MKSAGQLRMYQGGHRAFSLAPDDNPSFKVLRSRDLTGFFVFGDSESFPDST